MRRTNNILKAFVIVVLLYLNVSLLFGQEYISLEDSTDYYKKIESLNCFRPYDYIRKFNSLKESLKYKDDIVLVSIYCRCDLGHKSQKFKVIGINKKRWKNEYLYSDNNTSSDYIRGKLRKDEASRLFSLVELIENNRVFIQDDILNQGISKMLLVYIKNELKHGIFYKSQIKSGQSELLPDDALKTLIEELQILL